MAKIEDILTQMKNNASNVRFSDLSKVYIYYFGQARQKEVIMFTGLHGREIRGLTYKIIKGRLRRTK